MKPLILAVALCCGGAAHAGLVNFNDPGVVDIDNATGLASYAEAGFAISGPAASFLPLDGALVGGFDATPFSFGAAGGGMFGLQLLDVAPYDLGFGPGVLVLTGLVGGVEVVSRSVDLAGAASLSFDAAWSQLTAVSFTASGGFALDNVSTVPEPGGFALAGVALALAGAMRWRRR